MSSIYRKGRDGYFYYQAYVLDPKTGRKNKRIFHSLGTKSAEEAKLKQEKLDEKYENLVNKNYGNLFIYFSKYYKYIVAILSTAFITAFLGEYFANDSDFYNEEQIIDKLSLKNDLSDSNNSIDQTNSIGSSQEIFEKPEKSAIIKDYNSKDKDTLLSGVAMPAYEIQRIENLSKAFKQGRIFITVAQKNSDKSLRLLCEQVVKDFPQFQNIIICIYKNDKIGQQLALGLNEKVSPSDKKNAWLAMYTYNSVEGAFFDGNPTEYLGGV